MANPQGTPPWYNSPQRIAALSADQGIVNLVSGSSLGAVSATGGSVDLNAAAGPNGLPGFRFNAASGGYLQFANLVPKIQQPFELIMLARVRTPVDKGTLAAAPGLNFKVQMKGTTQFQMLETAAAPGIVTPVLDPTQWQLIDTLWNGTISSAFSINGGTPTTGSPNTQSGFVGWQGLSIGGGSLDAVRLDVDMFAVEVWNGKIPYVMKCQFMNDLAARTGLSFSLPPAYSPVNPTWPPQLASRPTAWPATGANRTIYFATIGQSNDVGYANGSPIVTPSANVFQFNLLWQVTAAANPMKAQPLGAVNGISADGAMTSGYQGRFCNDIATALGRNITVSVDSLGLTSSSQWLPGGSLVPSTLYDAFMAKLLEAQYWGQQLGGIIVCQGESDTDATAWTNNWNTIINSVRATLGFKIPFFFVQTPSVHGVRATESSINNPSNNVFFIPTTLGANLQGDNTHWTPTGYDLAGQAISAQILSGWPYFP